MTTDAEIVALVRAYLDAKQASVRATREKKRVAALCLSATTKPCECRLADQARYDARTARRAARKALEGALVETCPATHCSRLVSDVVYAHCDRPAGHRGDHEASGWGSWP